LTLVAAAAILLALRGNGAREAAFFTAFASLASLAFLVGVYWTTPLDYDYHVTTSVRRVITAPIVFAAAMAPLLLSRAPGDQTLR